MNKHSALLVLTVVAALLASCAPAPDAASPTAAPTQPAAPEAAPAEKKDGSGGLDFK